MLYVFAPLGFWAMGVMSIHYSLSEGAEYLVKAAIWLLALLVAFVWVGLSGYRNKAVSATYLAVVFGIPIVAASAVLGFSYVN